MLWFLRRLDVWMERRSDGLYSKSIVRFDEKILQPPTLKVDAILDSKTRKIDVNGMLEHFELSFLANRFPELSVFKDHRQLLDARLNLLIGVIDVGKREIHPAFRDRRDQSYGAS